MRGRYKEAAEWRLLTEGAFTPERPDGALDLSGIVKGHAIREAGTSLLALGMADWCLNAGGDVLVSGSPAPGSDTPWRAGIVDPADRRTLLAGFPLGGSPLCGLPLDGPPLGGQTPDGGTRAALATSGSAERGDHIWSATASAVEFVQVSVAAADVVTADVLATAIVAGGIPMLNRATAMWDIDVLAVRADGDLLATQGFRAG
jgi:thiamine biosynthesis lipoprotein